jgi:hypothetical protein
VTLTLAASLLFSSFIGLVVLGVGFVRAWSFARALVR